MAADNEPSELDVLGDLAVPVEVGSNDTEGERKGFHMVNVNLNIASRTPYMPPAVRRKMETPASTGTSASGTDFGTELKNQSEPAAITTATTIAAATTAAATTTIAAATTAAATTTATTAPRPRPPPPPLPLPRPLPLPPRPPPPIRRRLSA